MSNSLRMQLGLESGTVFSPSTIELAETDTPKEYELMNDVTNLEVQSNEVLTSINNITKVDNAVESLESILLTLQVTLENHSVNNYTYALSTIALEHIERDFSLPSGYLTVGFEDNNEETSSGMMGKIKSMLGELKDAGSKLFDKIAEGLQTIRKDVINIGARVKQRIQELRKNLNKSNSGGHELNGKILNKLVDVSNNGVVDERSFLNALNKTVNITTSITGVTIKADPISNFMKDLSVAKENAGIPSAKLLGEYVSAIDKLTIHDKSPGNGFTSRESDVLIDGSIIRVNGMDTVLIKEIIAYVRGNPDANKILEASKNIDKVSQEDIGNDKQELRKISRGFLPGLLDYFENKGYDRQLVKECIESFVIWFFSLVSTQLIPYIVASGVISPFVGVLLILILGGVGIVHGYKFGLYLEILHERRLQRMLSTESNSNENYNLSMENFSNPDEIIAIIRLVTSKPSLVKKEKSNVNTVKSLSFNGINTALKHLESIIDATSSLMMKTKERKQVIKDYHTFARIIEKASGDEANTDLVNVKDVTNFLKRHLAFEVDYCKSLTSIMTSVMAYCEASNAVKG